jgi:hypothetical protein
LPQASAGNGVHGGRGVRCGAPRVRTTLEVLTM